MLLYTKLAPKLEFVTQRQNCFQYMTKNFFKATRNFELTLFNKVQNLVISIACFLFLQCNFDTQTMTNIWLGHIKNMSMRLWINHHNITIGDDFCTIFTLKHGLNVTRVFHTVPPIRVANGKNMNVKMLSQLFQAHCFTTT
jgi:hypothetical protein